MPGPVNRESPDHVVALMDAAFRTVRRALGDRFSAHLRPSHYRLLSLVPPDGIRLSDLAVRAGMTKQALGEFVVTLQESGHLDVRVDPSDRRARTVRLSAKGRRVNADVERTIADLERSWAATVGQRRWATFRAVLTELGRPED